ncbi:hypothetical protein CH291_00920 [Rhodococcus sp. 14-1411-2a]|nr:hypothetical protein CH291_00920 [Rhodococcus sp. 14-1411-2a]
MHRCTARCFELPHFDADVRRTRGCVSIARTRVQARRSPGNRSSVGNRVPFSKSGVVALDEHYAGWTGRVRPSQSVRCSSLPTSFHRSGGFDAHNRFCCQDGRRPTMAGFVPHDPVKADPDRIRRASARMSGLADVLWDDIDLVRLAAEESLETSWTGAAADSHAVLWAEWVDSARKICGALTEDAWLLDGIATEYAASDNVIDEHVVDSGLRLDR